jgi:hypothetical protein
MNNNGDSSERESSKRRVIELVEHQLPEFVNACKNTAAPAVIMHQDAFAADYQEAELLLLGAAIKYAGMHNKNVTIVSKS